MLHDNFSLHNNLNLRAKYQFFMRKFIKKDGSILIKSAFVVVINPFAVADESKVKPTDMSEVKKSENNGCSSAKNNSSSRKLQTIMFFANAFILAITFQFDLFCLRLIRLTLQRPLPCQTFHNPVKETCQTSKVEPFSDYAFTSNQEPEKFF